MGAHDLVVGGLTRIEGVAGRQGIRDACGWPEPNGDSERRYGPKLTHKPHNASVS